LRVPVVAGNWKMHKTRAEAAAFVEDFLPRVASVAGVEIVLCPPFTSLCRVARMTEGTNVSAGAQDLHHEPSGAYTGEVSPAMVRDAGARYAIVGHSERRQLFGETDEAVNLKAKAALAEGLVPIVCVGETLEEREEGRTFPVVERQLRAAVEGIASVSAPLFLLAYEPVWAIGTGRTATPEQAREVHERLRALLRAVWGEGAAEEVRILYGGSVKPDNMKELMATPHVDGALVGGASLEPASFEKIVKFN
jgi:triosephosphate isomerase